MTEKWYPVVFVERDSNRKLAISKHDTKERAITIAQRWVDSTAERIEVWELPERSVIWRSE